MANLSSLSLIVLFHSLKKPYSFFPSPFVLLRSCRQTYSRILRCIANDEVRCFVIFYFRHKAYEYKSQVGMSSYVGPM
ncbi:hypothetical protein QL285_077136 [Trifolium repens]|nr:hypothetical protein QL285_077136 [Trifolium repens]